MKYYSSSKKAWLEPAEMNDFQLCAATRKLRDRLEKGEDTAPNDSETLKSLRLEVEKRKLDLQYPGGLSPEQAKARHREKWPTGCGNDNCKFCSVDTDEDFGAEEGRARAADRREEP